VVGFFAVVAGSAALSAAADGPIVFRDVTAETGIDFIHTDGSSGRRYIMETLTAGLALFDYDSDGDVDVYFLNGAPLKGTEVARPPRNALYRNDGGFRFTDVTDRAGVGDTGYGLGVAVGDYDNDGHPDLYLNNFGPNVFYRNNGDGTFADVSRKTGTADGDKFGAGACFLDIDNDGHLDLYVANYLEFSYQIGADSTRRGVPMYAIPELFPPVPDDLFRNNGDGTFTDFSRQAGIAGHAGWGMGMVCFDYDDDGDTDIFVGNDVMRNFLFQNDGSGKFDEVAMFSGVALDVVGDTRGSMGVGCGDYNNDGRLDLYVTSYQQQLATLYENLGDGLFEDVTLASGAGRGTFEQVTWGNDLVDFDNDGDRDLFIACGHLEDNVELHDDTASYYAANLLLMNDGRGKFVDVSSDGGDGMQVKLSSRGAGFDDLDGDGDIDVVILNSRREPTILRNDSPNHHHWLDVTLHGVRANRDAVGARVRVVAGDLVQTDELHSGRGYQSHYGTRLHFGLGTRERIDRLEVRWPGGNVDVLNEVPVDRVLVVTEGQSINNRSGK
jgi:hypothetical protein